MLSEIILRVQKSTSDVKKVSRTKYIYHQHCNYFFMKLIAAVTLAVLPNKAVRLFSLAQKRKALVNTWLIASDCDNV